MGKYEVTQREYLAVMGNNPSCFQPRSTPRTWIGRWSCVSWDDAVAYCAEADGARAGGGADWDQRGVSAADGGGVGVCVSGGDDDAVLLWGRAGVR